MKKIIIKEICIILLLCIAVMLVFGIVFYEYIPISKVVPTKISYTIPENIKNEFIFKLFCRVFLINNVIEYEPEDKIKNYKFFNYFLNNKEKNIKDLLFSSNIIFER